MHDCTDASFDVATTELARESKTIRLGWHHSQHAGTDRVVTDCRQFDVCVHVINININTDIKIHLGKRAEDASMMSDMFNMKSHCIRLSLRTMIIDHMTFKPVTVVYCQFAAFLVVSVAAIFDSVTDHQNRHTLWIVTTTLELSLRTSVTETGFEKAPDAARLGDSIGIDAPVNLVLEVDEFGGELVEALFDLIEVVTEVVIIIVYVVVSVDCSGADGQQDDE